MHKPHLQFALLLAFTAVPAASAFADAPSFHHHRQGDAGDEQEHYKDDSDRTAHVKVGQTLFKSRALVNKAGVTDVEITTGSFDDSSTPPGNITGVHVKAYKLDGKRQFDHEFEHLRGGGYVHFAFPLPPAPARGDRDGDDRNQNTTLVRGQALRLHAEARGLRGGDEGEGEARIDDMVRYRPCLAVTALNYPAIAKMNTDVEFLAEVGELMKDTSAHASCSLSIDGVEADRVPIWVAADSSVSCHFAYNFKSAGKHTVTVNVLDELPGDFDGEHTTMSGTIDIQNPTPLAYLVSARDTVSTTSFVQDVFASGGATPDQHTATQSSRHSQTRVLNGTIPAGVNLPLKTVSFSDQTDGNALSSFSYSGLDADSTSALPAGGAYDTVAIVSRFDAASGGWFTLRKYTNSGTGAASTTVNVSFQGGEVTFHSDGYCKSVAGVFTCAGGDYTRNPPLKTTATGAPLAALGSSYGMDVTVDDGSSYQAHPKFALTSTTQSASSPQTCTPTTVNGTPANVCKSSSSTTTMVAGNASYQP